MNQLVTTDWLDKNIKKVKILDASWHLPITNRNSFEEYKAEHIVNSKSNRRIVHGRKCYLLFNHGYLSEMA